MLPCESIETFRCAIDFMQRIFISSVDKSLAQFSMPQLSNVSENIWKRKGSEIFSVYFLKVEEQRVRKRTSCSKGQ